VSFGTSALCSLFFPSFFLCVFDFSPFTAFCYRTFSLPLVNRFRANLWKAKPSEKLRFFFLFYIAITRRRYVGAFWPPSVPQYPLYYFLFSPPPPFTLQPFLQSQSRPPLKGAGEIWTLFYPLLLSFQLNRIPFLLRFPGFSSDSASFFPLDPAFFLPLF